MAGRRAAANAFTAREPVQSRAHRTRAALLQAAEQELNERGYAQTTTKSIADRAGVAAGSFYQYFPDKDAVLRELASARLQALRTRIDRALGPQLLLAGGADAGGKLERIWHRAVRAMIDEVIAYHRK